jgi:uncharacterized integral membrane protein (TIGR00698 family)
MSIAHLLLPLGALVAFTPWGSSALCLILGIALAMTVGNPYVIHTKKLAPKLLGVSIVGLGAGMNLSVIAQAGLHGIGLTVISITMTMFVGWLIGKILEIPQETSILVSVGTAICGGSAIAATASAIKAKDENTSVALGIIFILNALGLLLFPLLGHFFGLNQNQFGYWAALAIHDTSSVVGAAMRYGPRALEVATTVKLTRALWIAPVVLVIKYLYLRRSGAKVALGSVIPWFIAGFLIASALVTVVPPLRESGVLIATLAKKVLMLALFCIGANLSRAALKKVGPRPLAQGILLWMAVAMGSLFLI